MSRCFPYPPPGYKLDKASSDIALIESIKLQREREQAKAERKKQKKDKKREKKEKTKENKKKASLKYSHSGHDQKIDKVEKSCPGPKDGFVQCVRKEENEHLERSSLTEEHEQPIHSQNPSTSSDSTENSNKRKRHTCPPPVVKQEEHLSCNHGNVIKFRLPLQKKQVDNASVVREAPCSTSGRTDLPAVQKRENANGIQDKIFTQGTDGIVREIHCGVDGGQICSTSGKIEAVTEGNASISGCKKHEKKLKRRESRYKNLMENLIPLPLQTNLDFDDEDWILARKNPEKQVEKKLKAEECISYSSSSALWPRVQLLSEADIYALPFTVPF